MNTSDVRAAVVEKLAELHYVPFYVHFLTIDVKSQGKLPSQLPEFRSITLQATNEVLQLRLKPEMEWRDALLEASTEKMGPGELPLTPNARALLDWLNRPENSPVSIKVNTLGKKAGFKGSGSYHRWKDYCREIDLKTGFRIEIGKEHGSWGEAIIDLALHNKSEEQEPGNTNAPNPHFDFDPTKVTKEACDTFARILEDMVMVSANPENDLDLVIYDLSTHVTLQETWPATLNDRETDSYEVRQFLEKVRLAPCLRLTWSLPWHGDRWLIGCRPVEGTNWETVRQKLSEWRAFKGSQETFALSKSAALVLDWLLSLRPDQFLHRLSPPVAAAWENEIGLKMEYDSNKRGLLLESLVDEINERTPYELRVLPSKDASYQNSDCRLLFKRTPTAKEQLVRQIRHHLLDCGSNASEAQVSEWLDELTRKGGMGSGRS
jgi:hypothetical protein